MYPYAPGIAAFGSNCIKHQPPPASPLWGMSTEIIQAYSRSGLNWWRKWPRCRSAGRFPARIWQGAGIQQPRIQSVSHDWVWENGVDQLQLRVVTDIELDPKAPTFDRRLVDEVMRSMALKATVGMA